LIRAEPSNMLALMTIRWSPGTNQEGEPAVTQQISIDLTVNGEGRHAAVPARTVLVDLIRDTFGLTGTKVGCDSGTCGSCTVLMDDADVKSCTVLAAQADGVDVVTVEALGSTDRLGALQEAFHEAHGLQCGFCTPGMLMAITGLLRTTPAPSEADIRRALEGNLCRCTGYQNVVDAVQRAVWTTASPIKMIADTPGKRFYQRQVEALLARDVDSLVDDNYHPDARLTSGELVVKGHDAIREHFRELLSWLTIKEVDSTDKFMESEDTVMFEATVTSNLGRVRVYDAFVLDDGKARYHFTGVM
jgi:aerobic carbon-monoxide dehydrogenase small subunit